jgi:hypothetical protein
MNNPNYDESDGKFDKGDIVTNRVDLLTEVDFSYRKRIGGHGSARPAGTTRHTTTPTCAVTSPGSRPATSTTTTARK